MPTTSETIRQLTSETIRQLLDELNLPAKIANLNVADGHAALVLEIDAASGPSAETLRQQVESRLLDCEGVQTARVILTAEQAGPTMPGRKVAPPKPIAGVKRIIAVASGKGGVGKSTTAVNLALALQHTGWRTGLLDIDIYGPSLPRLLNISGPPEVTDDKRMIPPIAHGMPVLSMGFLMPEEKAAIRRGAMVQGAVTQLLHQAVWNVAGDLDALVVDLPPGTGDAQLTLTQSVPLSGAVIVSTPQDLALIDARKAVQMFQRLDVPVLGLIENMSYYACPSCGHRAEIFGHGGARADAARMGIPFLGEIPLDLRIRETSDAGTPIVLAEPEGEIAGVYREIALKVLATGGL